MSRLLTTSDLEKVSTLVAAQMGLSFPPAKWRNLEQSLCNAARELDFADVHACIDWFTSSPPSAAQIEKMACYLTIGETYFMREKRCFEVLEQQILPELVKKRQGSERRLRFWSSGCSTGEEAYSIAILLHRMRETLRGWDLSILATDINPQSLAKAKAGVYGEWSFRTTPASFRECYFTKSDEGRYALLPAIKEMVTFAPFNLVEDSYPSLVTDTNAMDVIFCRNVLMYFSPELSGKVVERFHRCLLDDGWLFVSPCETSTPIFSSFASVSFPDATLYQKRSNGKGCKPVVAAPLNFSAPLPAAPVLPSSLLRSHPQEAVPGVAKPSSSPPPVAPPSPPSEATTLLYQEALALYEQGAYPCAAEKVAALLLQRKDDTRALALLCRIYANQGRLSEALNTSTQALASDKLSPELHYLRAVILQEQGLDDESAAALKKALYLDQDLVLAHFSLANLEQRKGKVKESRRYYNTAASLLDKYSPDEVIPGSDGMLAGRLKEIIRATTARM